ncbi:tagatose 1,6-diphosphate aldolase [Limnochorda pilosa]|uniref:Tagatose-bisphosphate aldolase n=1 Tax=Limnochorda pilosa TaxID=1555112 RepID=A0A0K2SJ07_LIMPI|nr:tagatose 1,6-diphosphate aldolase [Limnochorda pilosa]BAS27012.1 tagatose-bisphosphate aldolase [Limnochorda pilosa]
MESLTIGRWRGLQQLSTPEGVFCIVAVDQRGALKRMLEGKGRSSDPAAMTAVKREIVGALNRDATGFLLDPEFGAAPLAASGDLLGRNGLAVSLEATGYEERAGDRLSSVLDGWSEAKIKAMGASAVKLLIYYNPRREAAARHQEELVRQVSARCRALDIALMVEVVTYPSSDDQSREAFQAERRALVVESAARITALGIDLFKAEFPVAPAVTQDEAVWYQACRELTEASRTPWALLSAGVDFDTYARQLKVACRAGASGFVAGRAIWREAAEETDSSRRQAFLNRVMPERLRELVAIARREAAPWTSKLSASRVDEGWYRDYRGLEA